MSVVSFDDVTCKKDTGKAILVNIDGDEYWIPQSVVDDDSEVYTEGNEGTLIIKEWFAVKEGLV